MLREPLTTAQLREPLTTAQLHVLQHSLGLDEYGRGTSYRNHYVDEPSDLLRSLVDLGLMVHHGPREIAGGMHVWTVTDLGRARVAEESPRPPKLTRGQRRYREFLAADTGMSLGEWLRCRGASTLAVLALFLACSRPAAPVETPAVREALMLRAEVERMAVVAEREFQIALALNAAWATNEALRCRGIKEAK